MADRKWDVANAPETKTMTPDDHQWRSVSNPRGIKDEVGPAQTTTPRDSEGGKTPAFDSGSIKAFPKSGDTCGAFCDGDH